MAVCVVVFDVAAADDIDGRDLAGAVGGAGATWFDCGDAPLCVQPGWRDCGDAGGGVSVAAIVWSAHDDHHRCCYKHHCRLIRDEVAGRAD